MGLCKCGKEVFLKNNEICCDSCGTQVEYVCWNCGSIISVENAQKIYKEEKQCSFCGFYVCDECDKCGRIKNSVGEWEDCNRTKVRTELRKDKKEGLKPTSTAIIQIVGNVMIGKNRRYCHRGIAWTHAKLNIKKYYCYFRGWATKGENDTQAFRERYDKILAEEIGNSWTVKSKKEAGEFGNELRVASNMGVCLGSCKIIEEENKKKWYKKYVRVDTTPCPFFNFHDLFNHEKNRMTNISTCSYPSSDFKVAGEIDE